MNDPHQLAVSLVTLGDPATLTGGYLYHRRVAALAPRFAAQVDFVSFPVRRFPLPAFACRDVLRQVAGQRADVLLLDSLAAAYLAPQLALRAPAVPVVGMLHQPPGGIDAGGPRRAAQAVLDRIAWRHARLLLVASAALADQLRGAGVPDRLLRVVPPGRDPTPAAAPPSDLRRGRRTAGLSVGNWVRRKGLLDLLDALGRLPPDAMTLHLVGDPDVEPAYAARVRTRLAAPDLAERVVVHGALPAEQVAAMYGAVDVFALASRREPYGTVYGEAMGAGVPVVGWHAGNLPYLARDGREGLVVAPGDVAALAVALERLAYDAPLRRRLGRAAATRATQFPTWEETTGQLVDALREVVATRP